MNFDFIANRFPTEKESINRFTHEIETLPVGAQLDLNRIYDVAVPRDADQFVLALGAFVSKGLLKRSFRVSSPKWGGGIAEYDSLAEIPDVIHDTRTDKNITVTSHDVSVIFSIVKALY
ncbi:MAG: hypothetical protein K9M54_04410 [Kiritimatiellales bacterium]|nr:hypothetical protein [Kiritimatiellales bacterium]